jgi:ribosomal protein L19
MSYTAVCAPLRRRICSRHRGFLSRSSIRFMHMDKASTNQSSEQAIESTVELSELISKVRQNWSLKNSNPLSWLKPIPSRQPHRGKQSCSFTNLQSLNHCLGKSMTVHPQIPSAHLRCKEPLKAVAAAEFQKLDPTGVRRRLFQKNGADAIHVRDIIMVRTRTGDPFSGVVIRIQRKQHDSSVLLRNTITGVGVEREYKIYSPNVTGIELIQKRPRTPKQSRLFYMR